ncbi:MAG: SH3 domain-containing protein [Clostridia bacterium]|nr:SH3 domain-containing protein [Clostridia bacterium]
MKRLLAFLVMLVVVCASTVSLANGDLGYYYSRSGIVICTNVSIRESPSTSAKAYGQLHNGDSCLIVGRQGNWLLIDLASCGFKNNPEGVGYAKASLISEEPYWIVLTKYTVLYTDPWGTGDSNGEKSAGTPLLVTSENGEFYCVQTKSGSAGASFIRKRDVGWYSNSQYAQYIVIDGDVPLYDYYGAGSNQVGKLKTLTIVDVISYGGAYSYICYGNDNYAWIETQHLQRIAN